MTNQHSSDGLRPEGETASRPLPEPETADAQTAADGKPAVLPGPGFCKRYMRQRFADALPAIADTLLDHAQKGDIPALKLILQIAELEDEPELQAAPHRCKSLEEMLMADWRKEPHE